MCGESARESARGDSSGLFFFFPPPLLLLPPLPPIRVRACVRFGRGSVPLPIARRLFLCRTSLRCIPRSRESTPQASRREERERERVKESPLPSSAPSPRFLTLDALRSDRSRCLPPLRLCPLLPPPPPNYTFLQTGSSIWSKSARPAGFLLSASVLA